MREGRYTPVEELNRLFDTAAEPNLVHLELHPRTPVDPARLRAAVHAVLAAPPLLRRAGHRGWSVPAAAEAEPYELVPWDPALRGRLLSAPLPVAASPLFRVTHATSPAGDVVLLRTHHMAFDGIATLALLGAVTRAYRGLPFTLAQVTAPAPSPGPPPRPPRGAVRVAPDGGSPGAPGYGALTLTTDVPGSPDGTVNDVLVAALALTVHRWNEAHATPPGPVRVTVPVNERAPAGRWEGIGNCSRLITVSVPPPPRPTEAASGPRDAAIHGQAHGPRGWAAGDPADGAGGAAPDLAYGLDREVVAGVARQTAAGRAAGGPPVPLSLRALGAPWAPAAVRGRVAHVLRRAGARFADTTIVSNLGVPDDPPRFGDAPEPLWFSLPAAMPRGLSVGAVTTGGRLRLCLRYRRSLLGPAAAAEFAAAYVGELALWTA